MQHETGPLAIECHERCARFHILAQHFERDRRGFSIALEEQQLMNTLQSLKEFYEDQRNRHESPNELEMRIYHRLVHIRDQRERHDDISPSILTHPVFLLTTKFRQHVQEKSSPITKSSALIVDQEGMLQFIELAALLREQGNRVMVYLVACILERLFGKDTIEDIEAIRDGISIPDIIDGVIIDDGVAAADGELNDYDEEEAFLREEEPMIEEPDEPAEPQHQPKPLKPSATEWLTNNFSDRPSPSVMLGATSSTSVFGTSSTSAFGSSIPVSAPDASSAPSSVPPAASAFANLKTTQNVFGDRGFGSGSAFGSSSSSSAFGTSSAFGSTSSVPKASGTMAVISALQNSAKASSSFSPPSAFTSAPVVSNIGDQPTATSVSGSLFARSITPSTSQTPVPGIAAPSSSTFFTSQRAPSRFPTNTPAGSTPPTSTVTASEQKRDRPSATLLDPKAPAFTPGQLFGVPASTTSVQAEKEPTANIFSPSSSAPAVSTSTTPTRPILPPINTSPLTSASPSNRPPANLTTSQSAPPLNGSTTKHPSLERQPTIVDGFRPSGMWPGNNFAVSEAPEANTTPQHPPPLKMQPISLPGTPTTTSYSPPTKQKTANNLFGWPSVQSISAPDILSPLVISAKSSLASLPSPPVSARPSLSSLSRFPSTVELPTATGQPGPSQATSAEPQPLPKATTKSKTSPISPQDVEMASPTAAPMRNGKSKGKSKAPAVDAEDLEAQASAFVRTSALMRGALKRWSAKFTERVLYNDAVRRSDAYTGQKTKKRQEARSPAEPEPEAKRTAKTRTRRRVSAKYAPPQTDAELARRLKENHDQHERRWAPGTFLAALRTHVGNPAPFDYCLWLSLNPENDGTAIWVERKFDMPNSGAWVSERVFSIPLAHGAPSHSPGLVVFECSPLHGVDDEIEKKYRVLDDCARLREVIETFPEDRHFIPSVLFILWGEDESEMLPDDLRRMAGDYEAKSIIGPHAIFSLSSKTKDLDEKFRQVLISMDLDMTGGLVEILSRQEYLQLVIAPWKVFASDWVARCTTDGEVDWVLFSKVFEVLVKLMNTLSCHFTTRLDESAVSNPLPEIRLDGVKSSSELYDATFGWLEHKDLRTCTPSREFRVMLQSHRTSNTDFPVHASVSMLYELSVRCIEGSVRIDRTIQYPIPKRDIEETTREVDSDVGEAAAQLRPVFLFHLRPKRPPPDDDDAASVLSMSPSSKRFKSTLSTFSTIDDLAHSGSNELMLPPSSAVSPSTSVTTIVNEEKPEKVITVAMLRALTQSVLKNGSRG
ncbi:hypothetical protein BJV74DRAFT_494229 [Russula compacta]|nr:hypothetical protein BJV74DRAFT_494229 [Russula compacta]